MNTARKEHCLLYCSLGTLCIHYTPIICIRQEKNSFFFIFFGMYKVLLVFYQFHQVIYLIVLCSQVHRSSFLECICVIYLLLLFVIPMQCFRYSYVRVRFLFFKKGSKLPPLKLVFNWFVFNRNTFF